MDICNKINLVHKKTIKSLKETLPMVITNGKFSNLNKKRSVKMAKFYVAVVGTGSKCSKKNASLAYEIGKEIASKGGVVVCGGTGGVFSHAFRGAKTKAGQSIAIVGGAKHEKIPRALDHVICTGIGAARHALIATTCCGAIVIEGWIGSLAIVCEFLAQRKPVVLLRDSGGIASTYSERDLIEGAEFSIYQASSAKEAVKILIKAKR